MIMLSFLELNSSMTIRVSFTYLAILILAGCSIFDDAPPTVAIIQPEPNTLVKRSMDIIVSAEDNHRVREVKFYIDGKLLGSDSKEPYKKYWNAYFEDVGGHQIYAEAVDKAGNSG